MTKLLSFIVVCTLFGVALSAVENIAVQKLSEIEKSTKIWLIYTSKGDQSKKINILDDVSQILTGFYKVGKVKGQSQSLKFYGDNGQSFQYSGNFVANDIVDWALDNTQSVLDARSKVAKDIKSNKQFQNKESQRAKKQWEQQQNLRKKSDVYVVNTQNWEQAFIQERNPVLMNIYEANCSSCIDTNKEWQAVATALKGSVKVIKINITDSEQLQKWIQEENYPSIRFYPVGKKSVTQFDRFQGIKKQFSIRQWVSTKLAQKKSSIDIPELNKQNYNNLCKNSKATCIIIFTENPSKITSEVGQLATKYLKKPIVFLVSKKGSQKAFEKQVGVDGFPSSVMMYCSRKKMLKMNGLNFTNIDEVINEITLGNRNNFIKYKFDENIA